MIPVVVVPKQMNSEKSEVTATDPEARVRFPALSEKKTKKN
jgi:hypothetical protein